LSISVDDESAMSRAEWANEQRNRNFFGQNWQQWEITWGHTL